MNIKYILPIILLAGIAVSIAVYSSPRPQEGIPLDRVQEREKLLTFGLFVTPDLATNPIDPPERFIGYHSGLDLEIFEDEIDKVVVVRAICDGEVRLASVAEGYGGLFVQSCNLDNQEASVFYGHLDPNSFKFKEGDFVKRGMVIGELGDHKTAESGDNRKHLHIGIHKGDAIEYLGYVQEEKDLENFMNPMDFIE